MEKKLFAIILSSVLVGYSLSFIRGSEKKKPHDEKEGGCLNTCFITTPVSECSSKLEPDRFDYLADSVFQTKIGKNGLSVDTLMGFVTSYSFQKQISIAYSCEDILTQPIESHIPEIYLSSGNNANSMYVNFTLGWVDTIRIEAYGKARVLMYHVLGAPESATHSVYIIYKLFENPWGEDFKGIAFSCDSIKFNDLPGGFSKLSMINNIRRYRAFEMLLDYRDGKFVPIAHKKAEPIQWWLH